MLRGDLIDILAQAKLLLQTHHLESGLIDQCTKSTTRMADAETEVLDFIKRHCSESKVCSSHDLSNFYATGALTQCFCTGRYITYSRESCILLI